MAAVEIVKMAGILGRALTAINKKVDSICTASLPLNGILLFSHAMTHLVVIQYSIYTRKNKKIRKKEPTNERGRNSNDSHWECTKEQVARYVNVKRKCVCIARSACLASIRAPREGNGILRHWQHSYFLEDQGDECISAVLWPL